MLFDLPAQSPEQLILLTQMAQAVTDIIDWINWRERVNTKRKTKSVNEEIGSLWSKAVLSWYWLNGMPSRLTFAECCMFLDLNADKTLELIVKQFPQRRLSSIRWPEAVEWLRQTYVPDSMKSADGEPAKRIPVATFARTAMRRQAAENAGLN